MIKSKELHLEQIKKIRKALQEKNGRFSLKKNGTANSLRDGAYKKKSKEIDLGNFNGILEFNPEEKWILVEPKITFFELTTFTLQQNLIPPVVPEFTTITVGGAIMGASLESSSHKFGQVNDAALEYEMILGNGELITASPEQNADLFYGCAGSYGTLGILTAVKLRLIPAKKWVKCRYHRFDTVHEAVQKLIEPLDSQFAEGIVYSAQNAIVMTADMVDSPEKGKIFRQNRPWSAWYAHHVLHTKNEEDYMPIQEYLFRLDRGGFWVGRYVHSFVTMTQLLLRLGIPKVASGTISPSFLFRLLFGWCFPSKNLYKIWHRLPANIAENLFFIHDYYLPFSKVEEALNFFMKETEIFPIWLCPVKGTQKPQFLSPHYGENDFVDIGLYGLSKNGKSLSADLEKELLAFGGKKMLYSFTYYDEETFSRIYHSNLYRDLRRKYFAESAFPSLYTKVTNHIHSFE